MAVRRRDSVDAHISRWTDELPWLDPLDEQIVTRMMILTKHLATAREASFRTGGLARPSFKILMALRRQGPPYRASPSQLAADLGLSRGALSVRLSPLEDDGLITRTGDARDRRRVHVQITAAGLATFDEHVRHEGRDEAALLSALTPRDRQRLADLLRSLVLRLEGQD
jgi:DNA-binding MarR family transcriptional regulator